MIKKIISLLEKSVLKESIPQSTMFKVKFTFSPENDENKEEALAEFKKIKSVFKSVSDLKVLIDKKISGNGPYKFFIITGVCEIDAKTLAQNSKNVFVINDSIDFYLETRGCIRITSKQLIKAYKIIEQQVNSEKAAISKQKSSEFQKKSAAKLQNLPTGTFYLIETGESRGDEFGSTVKINVKDIFKTLYTTESNEDFFDKTPDTFLNLFYNVSLPDNDWQVIIEKILLSVLKGKMFIECWEEGTTGIGMDKKLLDIAVTLADAKSMKGLASKGDIQLAVKNLSK